jgi:putative acetyltransferase
MIIRNETASDIESIFTITKAAFEHHPHSEHTEQFMIKALRNCNALTVSLVAEMKGILVSHVAFSAILIADITIHSKVLYSITTAFLQIANLIADNL